MLKFLISSLIALACIAGLFVVAIGLFLLTTPRPTNIRECLTTEMFKVKLCPKDKDYVKIRDISANVKNAIIVSEDGAFYDHQGIDWFELRESFNKNWEKGEFARGGSTLTQQLAKNVYLSFEKSPLRKVREAMIAIQLERILSKEEILEKYLNVVEFGEKIYGVGKASRHYFNKPPSQLSVAEGAWLAFLLPSPKKYSASFRNKKLTKFAYNQMREIVNRLFRFKKISEDQQASAYYEIDHFFGSAPADELPGEPEELIEDDEMPLDEGGAPAEEAPTDEDDQSTLQNSLIDLPLGPRSVVTGAVTTRWPTRRSS